MAGFFGHIIKNPMIDDMRMEELVPAIKERLDESGHTTIAGDLLPIIIEIVAMESEFYTLSLGAAVIKVRSQNYSIRLMAQLGSTTQISQ